MIKPILILVLINFLFYGNCFSQSVRVFDSNDMQPVSNVYIYNTNKTKTTTTDQRGTGNISSFNISDTLVFQHPAYKNISASYSSIKNADFLLMLDKKTIYLSPIVISANKWEQNRKEVPSKISAISATEISFENPQTSADILGISNEVFIQKSQLGGGSPMIRGFSTSSVLLVIDGVRMNNAIYRSGNIQNVISIDGNNVENVEIVFGPGSVIYGSDALGGVMDFHTKNVKLAYIDKTNFSINAFTRYSSSNQEKTAHFNVNFGKKKWGTYTGITYSGFDDLKMGNHDNIEYQRQEYVDTYNGKDTILKNPDPNTQIYSGYNQFNLLQKIRYKPNNFININYSFHYSNSSNIPRYDRLIQYDDNVLKYAEWYYGPQKWMMNALEIKYFKKNQVFDAAKMTIALQNIEESRIDRKYRSNELRTRTENVDVYTANFDFEKNIGNRNTLFYGIEANINKVISSGRTTIINAAESVKSASRYPDGDNNYKSYAAYSSFKSNISDKTTLVAGLRYSYIKLNSTFLDTSFYNFPFDKIDVNTGSLNGSLGFVYRPSDSWQFNSNLSSGFRAPNLDDIAKVFDSEPGNVIVPNEDLGPEYAYNIDIGIIRNVSEKAKIDLTMFYTLLKDAMVRRDFTIDGKDSIMYDGVLSKVEAVVNASGASIYGASFTIYSELIRNFSIRSNLTYTYGRDDEDIPLRHVAPLFGSTALTYKSKRTEIELYANYNSKKCFKDLAPSEAQKPFIYATDGNGNPYSPSWWTINIKSSTKINEFLRINLGIEN
ncbi:MAG: TonB-dependent receptor, partial [Bacteroidales bacterium]|nr:TonB-dependent receptor [Bacteroidales bacterium]